MQDTKLYRYLLGIEPPWTVDRVKLDLVNQRVDMCGRAMKKTCAGHVRSVESWSLCMIMLTSESGVIWTVANSRPSFMPDLQG